MSRLITASKKAYFKLFQADPETYILAFFTIAHIFVFSNKVYAITIIVTIIALYKVSKNILTSLWYVFLLTSFFSLGKHFHLTVVENFVWGGREDLSQGISILFRDVIFTALLAVMLLKDNWCKKAIAKLDFRNKMIIFLLLLFLFVSGISVYRSVFTTASLVEYLRLTELILMFVVAKGMFTNKKVLNRSLGVMVMFLCFNSVLIIVQYIKKGPLGLFIEDTSVPFGWFASENVGLFRLGGIFSDPNISAVMAALWMPYLLIAAIGGTQNRHAFLIIIFFVIVGLVLTSSRASWVLTAMGVMIVYLFLKRKRKKKFDERTVFYLKIMVLVIIIVFGQFLFNRAVTLFGAFSPGGGANYRFKQLRVSGQLMTDFFWGVGLGNFPYIVSVKYPFAESGMKPAYVHNILAQVGAETGFVGLIIFCVFLYMVVREKISVIRHDRDLSKFGTLLSFIIFFISCNLFPWFANPKISFLFFILAAI